MNDLQKIESKKIFLLCDNHDKCTVHSCEYQYGVLERSSVKGKKYYNQKCDDLNIDVKIIRMVDYGY